MSFRWLLSITLLWFIPIACGPSVEEMEMYVDERMRHTIERLPTPLPTSTPMAIPIPEPTVTPVSFPTPLPTSTPMAIPTPEPTVTPVSFPTPLPTSTPMAIPTPEPTVTPVPFPTPLPTATPMAIPIPEPTVPPVPFPTPLPTATPMVIPTSEPQITPTPYRWQNTWPVVRIEIDNGRGNGVLISSSEVLTAYHVVDTGSFINVTMPGSNISGEETRSANLVGFNVQDDIALLNINPFSNSSDIDFAKLSPIPYNADGNDTTACQRAVNNGDVVVIETTGNSANFISVIRLWGKRSIGLGSGRKFLTDLDLSAGTSGSPIYNFAGRYLVGIVLEGTSILENRLYGIALDGCIIKERLPGLRSGLKF